MLEAAEQGGKAENAVDIEHQGRVDRVAHQRRRTLAAHHDGEDDDFDGNSRERQDHRAIGITDLDGEQFGMMGDADRGEHDGADQDDGCDQRDAAPHPDHGVFQEISDPCNDKCGDQKLFFFKA